MYAYQAAIKAKKGQRLSGAEKDVLHYQDVEKNWLPIGLVGLVSKENCRCGSSHSVFVGWYGILQHRNDISAKRICRITSAVDPINYLNAPSASYTMEKSVSVCGNCLSMDEASPDQILQWGLITLK
jgi:hypothetical protein